MGQSRLTIEDLDEVQEGDYGWCIYWPLSRSEPLRLVWYDDDEFWCSDLAEGETLDNLEEDHECGDGFDGSCFEDSAAIIYPTADITGPYAVVPHGCLLVPPAIRALELEDLERPSAGWIYAVAIVPDIDLCRIKVGFTERSIEKRLAQFRTANPTAMLLGLWPGDRGSERAAHDALPGRVGTSEVFQVNDLVAAFEVIDRAIRRTP